MFVLKRKCRTNGNRQIELEKKNRTDRVQTDDTEGGGGSER